MGAHRTVAITVAITVAATVSVLGMVACGGGERRRLDVVFVAPAVDDACGPPRTAGSVLGIEVFALGDFVEIGASGPASAGVSTELFPARTRALRLTLLGPGGVVLRAGRTSTVEFLDLPDGATLPVLVGPPRGFCRVGDLSQARRRPVLARAGAGVLVLGGLDGDGGVVGLAELYDPARGTFAIVADAPFDDLRGATATTLVDGRVLVTFRDGYQLFDPAAGGFGPALLAQGAELRAGAQSVRLADGRVAVLGGCLPPEALPPCAAATDAAIFDPATDELAAAPGLAVPRADGAAWLDGDGRVVLVGGFADAATPAASLEVWDPGAGSAATMPGAAGASAPLAAGGLVAAFAPAGETATATSLTVAPLDTATLPGAAQVARAGATLTALDDGAVLAVGGVPDGAGAAVAEAELLLPHAGRWENLAGVPGERRREHAAVRLDDGSVLIVGGTAGAGAGGGVRRDAWIYRHDLTGPWSTLPTQIFGFEGTPLVVPSDLGSASILAGPPAQLVLSSAPRRAGVLRTWAVLTGATYAEVELAVSVSVDDAFVPALILGFTGAGDHEVVLLTPGQRPQLVTVSGAQPGAPRCQGPGPLAADVFAGGGAHALVAARRDGRLRVSIDGEAVMDCADPTPGRGAVGIGGAGADGAQLRVRTLEARR